MVIKFLKGSENCLSVVTLLGSAVYKSKLATDFPDPQRSPTVCYFLPQRDQSHENTHMHLLL